MPKVDGINDLQLRLWQSEGEVGSGLGKGEKVAEMLTDLGRKVEDKGLMKMTPIFRGSGRV